MSNPSNTYLNNRFGIPNYDHLLAPVPQRRTQPVPGYVGFTAGIDGTLRPGVWSCGCGASPTATPYGVKDNKDAVIDPGTVAYGAFYSEVDCAGKPTSCTDPNAATYDANAQAGNQLNCIYHVSTQFEDCMSARTPSNGCNHKLWKHSHD